MRVWSLLKFYTFLVYLFMFAPIAVVLVLAFNSSQFGGFPIEGFSLRWFVKLAENEAIVRALRTSVTLGLLTALIATTLGILAGYVWRGQLMAQDRWSTRFGPIIGGLALLMFTGTGDENTDIGAHLLGFVCGFATGMLLTVIGKMPAPPRIQFAAGAAALILIAVSWLIALQV